MIGYLIFYLVSVALAVFVAVRVTIARTNRTHNRTLEEAAKRCRGEDGLFHGQGRDGLRDLRFGYYSVGRSGCGPIAIYNALNLFGTPVPLPDVIAASERGTPILGAKMGLNPLAIPGIVSRLIENTSLRRYKLTFSLRPPEECPFEGVLILTHLNGKALRDGAHTVAAYWAPDEGIYVANCYNHAVAPEHFASVAHYLRGRRMLFCTTLSLTWEGERGGAND